MLVIDGVELVLRHQPLEMGKFERDHDAFGLEQPHHAAGEVVEIGHLGEDVVADDQIGAPAVRRQLVGQRHAEELDHRLHALLAGGLGDVGRGLDPEGRHAERLEMLQQIAVIAGELDREAFRPEPEPLLDHRAIGPGVRDPGGRVGGEVGIFAEDALGADIFAELHQPAALAHQSMQRVERLHRIEAFRRHEALAKGRHAEIDEAVLEAGTAETAGDAMSVLDRWLDQRGLGHGRARLLLSGEIAAGGPRSAGGVTVGDFMKCRLSMRTNLAKERSEHDPDFGAKTVVHW